MLYNILFVDDEPLVLRAIVLMLEDEYQIDTASSGADGLNMMRSRSPYAAVMCDMNMPNMDGTEFLKRARELAPTTPRLLLTGCQDPERVKRSINEAQILQVLYKPCSVTVMSEALKNAVRTYEATLSGGKPNAMAQIDAAKSPPLQLLQSLKTCPTFANARTNVKTF